MPRALRSLLGHSIRMESLAGLSGLGVILVFVIFSSLDEGCAGSDCPPPPSGVPSSHATAVQRAFVAARN